MRSAASRAGIEYVWRRGPRRRDWPVVWLLKALARNISVSTKPGNTAVKVTPRGPSSARADSMMLTSAALLPLYAASYGIPRAPRGWRSPSRALHPAPPSAVRGATAGRGSTAR